MMDSKSQLKVDVIAKLSEGKLSVLNAAKLLSCSARTIQRCLKKYREIGIQFIVHGNTGRNPLNKISDTKKAQVQSLIKTKYYDVNL